MPPSQNKRVSITPYAYLSLGVKSIAKPCVLVNEDPECSPVKVEPPLHVSYHSEGPLSTSEPSSNNKQKQKKTTEMNSQQADYINVIKCDASESQSSSGPLYAKIGRSKDRQR